MGNPAPGTEKYASMDALVTQVEAYEAVRPISPPSAEAVNYDPALPPSLETLLWQYRNLERWCGELASQEIPDFSKGLPQRYRDLAQKALKLGEISTVRVAQYLGIGVQEAMKLDDGSDWVQNDNEAENPDREL